MIKEQVQQVLVEVMPKLIQVKEVMLLQMDKVKVMVKLPMVPMEIRLLLEVTVAELLKLLEKDHKQQDKAKVKVQQQQMEVQYQFLAAAVDLLQFLEQEVQVDKVVDLVLHKPEAIQAHLDLIQVVQVLTQVDHQVQVQLQSLMDVNLVVKNNVPHVTVKR
jgi:hypothetical protein